jgi:hypothetical protein
MMMIDDVDVDVDDVDDDDGDDVGLMIETEEVQNERT